MSTIGLKLAALALTIARSRATEPSSLAGIAVLAQLAKTYFPEIGIILDTVSGGTAIGAIFKAEKGNQHENPSGTTPDSGIE